MVDRIIRRSSRSSPTRIGLGVSNAPSRDPPLHRHVLCSHLLLAHSMPLRLCPSFAPSEMVTHHQLRFHATTSVMHCLG